MFDSLRRWARGQLASGEVPVEATVAAMDAAGVQTGMLCARWGPRGPLIANGAVAATIARYPGRFAGVAAVDLARPMDAIRYRPPPGADWVLECLGQVGSGADRQRGAPRSSPAARPQADSCGKSCALSSCPVSSHVWWSPGRRLIVEPAADIGQAPDW